MLLARAGLQGEGEQSLRGRRHRAGLPRAAGTRKQPQARVRKVGGAQLRTKRSGYAVEDVPSVGQQRLVGHRDEVLNEVEAKLRVEDGGVAEGVVNKLRRRHQLCLSSRSVGGSKGLEEGSMEDRVKRVEQRRELEAEGGFTDGLKDDERA